MENRQLCVCAILKTGPDGKPTREAVDFYESLVAFLPQSSLSVHESNEESELIAFDRMLEQIRRDSAFSRATHVMLVPAGIVPDASRLNFANASLTASEDGIVVRQTIDLEAELLGYSGRPDAQGRSERDRRGESALAEKAKIELQKAAPKVVYDGLVSEAASLNAALEKAPEEPQHWWKQKGAVGSILPIDLARSVIDWAMKTAVQPETLSIDQAIRWYLDVHLPSKRVEPRHTSAWDTILKVLPEKWEVENTYRVARGGEAVNFQLPSVAILTPAYGGMHARYTSSLLRVSKDLHENGIGLQVMLTEGESLVTRARHNLVHLFLMSTCTHMLFWDADLEPLDCSTVRKMLATGKPVVGGAYPYRDGSGRVVVNFLEEDENGQELPLGYHEERTAQVHVDASGCMPVRHIPTGFLLVERSVIVEMCQARPDLLYVDAGLQPALRGSPRWDLFGTEIRHRNYLSEDWAFCERWRELARDERHQVHVFVDAEFVHHGVTGSKGSLKNKMRKTT